MRKNAKLYTVIIIKETHPRFWGCRPSSPRLQSPVCCGGYVGTPWESAELRHTAVQRSSAPFSVSVCRPSGCEDCRVLCSDPSPSLLCLRYGFVGTWLHMRKSFPKYTYCYQRKEPFQDTYSTAHHPLRAELCPLQFIYEVLSSCTSEHDLPWRKGLDGSEDSRSHVCV